jgi:SagB-type dehydrogenase family enzyme
MKTRFLFISLSLLLIFNISYSQNKTIKLPQPQTEIGKPLMQCLKLRQSSREYSKKPLPLQVLSNLLWAADGINRPESGKRTAPTAMNNQEVDIYVTLPEGLYLYNAKEHSLEMILPEDIRAMAGKQDFVKDAALNLVYVADFSKMGKAKDEDKVIYSAADVGFIAQNVYLYCASEGLAVVIRAFVEKELLAKNMNLKPEQHIILSQTVGYPKE